MVNSLFLILGEILLINEGEGYLAMNPDLIHINSSRPNLTHYAQRT